jgi:SH3 domain-containing YSC84-like protein 1
MNIRKCVKFMTAVRLPLIPVFVALMLIISQITPAFADDKAEAKILMENARLTLSSFMSDSNMEAFQVLIKQAQGVLIAPQVLKGAYVIGAAGGNGVLLARDKKTGRWSEPSFYTIGEASFGLQIGGQASEIMLLVMSERGITSLLGNSLKLGADAGVAAGPVGVGAAAATANLSADIISFSRSKGLYGGVSLDGAVVAPRGDLNDAYYGKKVTPLDIIVKHSVSNRQAGGLIRDVEKAAAKK